MKGENEREKGPGVVPESVNIGDSRRFSQLPGSAGRPDPPVTSAEQDPVTPGSWGLPPPLGDPSEDEGVVQDPTHESQVPVPEPLSITPSEPRTTLRSSRETGTGHVLVGLDLRLTVSPRILGARPLHLAPQDPSSTPEVPTPDSRGDTGYRVTQETFDVWVWFVLWSGPLRSYSSFPSALHPGRTPVPRNLCTPLDQPGSPAEVPGGSSGPDGGQISKGATL